MEIYLILKIKKKKNEKFFFSPKTARNDWWVKKRKIEKNRALNSLSPSLLKTPQFLYWNPKYLRFYILKVKEIAMSKIVYRLKLRLPSHQKKNQQQQQQSSKPPHPPAFRFNDNDDDVESDISRQASKNKSLKDIEEQQKKALEEDPSVFDVESDIKTRAQLRSLFV